MINKDKNWWKPGLTIFLKVSGSIAIPIVIALYVGKYLDTRFNTAPWIFLGLTAIAFIISLVSLWKNVTSYIQNVEKEEQEKREKNNQ
jgi:F0F1-type ATP synthase assembly protein I